ncbi:C-5 cytosine-specific DNA methylase [Vibrio phage 1.233.A._10N.261.51.E6]|nr:C-5 cytosine-specific DNA methylase [Vibrio phage 1.233.A._10N.261.51.E6]AUR96921.1 C-5 cytosine-specific DNA methylase [Vibrio phage 1.233.B._10N.261.51.E6]
MKVLDLFSGIGGFSLGLEQAGFTTVKFCEIEEHCRKVLTKNFGKPIHHDITTLHAREGEFDVMCGGFPCQDISIAGKGAGLSGAKSGLWFEYKRLINEGRPRYAIIENVSALLGRGLEIILQDLAEIGYDATYTMYDSKYFGVPQRRRRVYIVAVRDGIASDFDFFKLGQRDSRERSDELESFDESFGWDFSKERGDRHTFTYLTRQRSNEFKEVGLSGTLAKRDYKSYTDLVIKCGIPRRVTPEERLKLQGFPYYWFEGCHLTNQQKFTCNGMTVPVVKHIGDLIKEHAASVDSDFFAGGHYRKIDDSDRGSSFFANGEWHQSAFSVNWLKKEKDYRIGK